MHEAEGLLYTAARTKELARTLFAAIARRRTFPGNEGELRAMPSPALRSSSSGGALLNLEPSIGKAEQSNTSVIFGDKYFLKLFRKVEVGINPDLEVGRFLTQRNFPNVPRVNGALEYQRHNGEKLTIGVLIDFLPNAKDAWEFTLDTLSRYYERVRTGSEDVAVDPATDGHILELAQREVPQPVRTMVGTYLEAARLLGAAVIVTGLSPEIAQTLVTIGVELDKMTTVGDLQGGSEEAERLLGYEVSRTGEPNG